MNEKYLEEKLYNEETFDDVINRTKTLSEKILEDKAYQNSIYVSHLSTINGIILNLYKNLGRDINELLEVESTDDFMKNHFTKPGTIFEIRINLDKKKINVKKI